MAFSTVGRYGSLSLINRTDSVVTAFGIDSELTFGRDPSAGVRLYYDQVSPVHCKIVFEERKAFLVVLGVNGMIVDGCKVFPNVSTASPATIALTNNSVIEIHNKRFRFTYPPKEIREQLFATPPRSDRRTLRLSMINSAQVFSPRPSNNPQENLRILQSPLKKSSTPPVSQFHDDSQEDIILVEGPHPHVVEEEKDLVILEDVVAPMAPSPSPSPSTRPPPPQTPRPRPSLHKLVLVRSAQRAVLKADARREEEEEEREVFGAILTNEESSEEEEEEEEGQEEEEKEQQEAEANAEISGWRKSLERIWPFGLSATVKDEPPQEESVPAPQPQNQPQTPPRRVPETTRPFMTPQIRPQNTTLGRMSLGGGGAQRVLVEQPWKVRDIVVPVSNVKPESPTKTGIFDSPMRGRSRESLSESERKAIQERRRSAVKAPNNFFPGGTPGMSPSKTRMASPTKQAKIIEETPEKSEEELDTRDLLERMKKTVDGIKSRTSLLPTRREEENAPMEPVVSVVDDPVPEVIPATIPKKRRGRLPALQETPSLADDEASPDMVGRGNEIEEEEAPKKRNTRVLKGKGVKKNALVPEEEPVPSSEPVIEAPARRSTRKPPSTVASSSEDTVPQRRRRAATPTETQLAVEEVVEAPRRRKAPNSTEAPRKNGTRGRKNVAEADSAIESSDAPVDNTKNAETIDADEQSQAKAKRTRAKKVKEEVEEPEEVVKTTTRARKPKKEAVSEALNKENTPGSAPADEEVVIVKVTRGRKAAAAKVKEEVLTEPELRPKRATRTRTKTVE
ncbi:hypothetical protein C8J56DRAFT_820576 [Mycena floridula]|nr:hypothetical protein C8J56DRAFT_820576 [Mycena floridula]